nr:hypothetical protein KXZ65_08560 [Pectobacterium sp. PL152]
MSDPRSRMEAGQGHYGPSLQQRLLEPLNSLILLGRRAVLALLGIAVGCGSVVALLNIGHNAEAEAMGVFRGMGSDLLVATVQNRLRQPCYRLGSGRFGYPGFATTPT